MVDDPEVGEWGQNDNEEAPLQDLVEQLRQREPEHPAAGLTDANLDNLFTREGVANVDIEAVWRSIEADSDDPLQFDSADIAEHIVKKRWYCEQCEYFTKPPTVDCMHDGTSIVEFVGTEKIRIRNCPIVAERKALGQFEGEERKQNRR